MDDSHYLGYELSWEDILLDVVDNSIYMDFGHAVAYNREISAVQL